ncbi:hypothetical protein [Micromonospora sp. KC213]|nr:hypothetical protein [Micromonospora sp. KC213]
MPQPLLFTDAVPARLNWVGDLRLPPHLTVAGGEVDEGADLLRQVRERD